MLKQNYKFLAIQSDESKKKIKVDYYDLQTDNHDELYQQITMPSSRERKPPYNKLSAFKYSLIHMHKNFVQ